jgi:hypothetical protein
MRALVLFGMSLATCCGMLVYRHTGLQQFTNRALAESMRNQHVLLIGDSLMRYQYLSLVHFLHTGQFSPEAGTGFLLNNTKMENIRDAAHRIFGSYEYTDIDRDKLFRENRHYHDKERNISIFYYLYWGDMWTTHGTFIPDPTLVGGLARATTGHTWESYLYSPTLKCTFTPYRPR